MKVDLRSLSERETVDLTASLGLPPFRGRQVFEWVHKHGALDIEGLKNLPTWVRHTLQEAAFIDEPKIIKRQESKRGDTIKSLLEFADGTRIEAALMMYQRGETRDRATCCVSTQSGCVMGCVFCATALCGAGRNLSAGEIVSQVLVFERETKKKGFAGVTNVVYMGMGEPLCNLEAVRKSLQLFNSPSGLNIGMRRMTVSTCGVVPAIYEMSEWGMQVGLAVSLHAPSDRIRGELMPITAKYPLNEVLKACKVFEQKTGSRTTFEYALFAGVNDSMESAHMLGRLLKGTNSFVNIIPANPVAKTGFLPSKSEDIQIFTDIVRAHGLEVCMREPRGLDIDAACGQLRGR